MDTIYAVAEKERKIWLLHLDTLSKKGAALFDGVVAVAVAVAVAVVVKEYKQLLQTTILCCC